MEQTQEEVKPNVSFSYDFEELINSVRHLDSINIKATERGLEVFGMDASNTMMTEVLIDREKLDKYNLSKEFQITTSIDYLRILKRFSLIKAYLYEGLMTFEQNSHKDNTRIRIPVFETQAKEKPKLDLKKAVSFELSVTDVRKALKDIESIGAEAFYLEFKDKFAVFTADGGAGKGGIDFQKSLEPYEKGITKYVVGQDSIKVYLSLELFRNALNGMSLGGKTRITLGENSPVIVENTESEYDKPSKKVTHYIAPRYYEQEESKCDEEKMPTEETKETADEEEEEESEDEGDLNNAVN